MPTLFSPIKLGSLELPNRIVLAPMTRSRAVAGDVPASMSISYYGQRASAGLLITEGTSVSPRSCAFEKAPGIYTEDQIRGWQKITDEVHRKGGRIFMQLWHGGRAGAYTILNGYPPLSPSGLNDDLDSLNVYGQLASGYYTKIVATPSQAMTIADIEQTIEAFRIGAINAIKAGMDGVEFHGANGYLIQQFLSPVVNRREDDYGGSLENRLRFLKKITQAVIGEVGAHRLGVRFSPTATYNNALDPNPSETYSAVAKMLSDLGVLYIHLTDTNAWAKESKEMPQLIEMIKPNYQGVLIGNGGITPETATNYITRGTFDLISFGRLFIANPDLPERIKQGGIYNELRSVGWWGGNEEGYIDYPSLPE
ncbi:alkene reductase [Candidatus Nitrosacidococcus tergens]|uniref:NADH:flavin oxidoreductase n=1 Tax=Candidatus Nitrosacidococcus tergens TaxID=553981 RepID=A0A7G1QAU3_9GAMM|nr:alkene reductase [Candidatus Nitrosacidococcus tergens]CAB1276252.1 NADH:flavin oxidoreductase [Candidatus Nitrosacidococcus tergens]